MDSVRTASLALLLSACSPTPAPMPPTPSETPAPEPAPARRLEGAAPAAQLTIVAEAKRRFTGVAVDGEGQVYVNFPRWSDDVPISVARLDASGAWQPFPDAAWNGWSEGHDPRGAWVCVQSVHVDGRGRLWVLDPGNPKFSGVVPGAPKLVRFELPSTTPGQVVRFDESVARKGSYLNDVRIDVVRDVAFMTDSGDGALVVVDLKSGAARRVLDDHPSTQAEPVVLTIGGKPFDRKVHADGIAYDPTEDYVYFQALTARTLYRIAGSALRDADLEAAKLASQVERVASSGASDGLLYHQGRVWISALEHDAIRTVRMGEAPVTVVSDPTIAWPDSFAAHGGDVLFTTAQIHLGASATDPFRVWRLSAR
ncbi:MAG: hypothetical protein JRI23_27830 [Deltaproteobacteria bacterium]|jgi:sugar lactone lactonase YvrE|nr:hypothetical protein [Deltaproteobacteria bacterium]MBW2535901.1 hypothetical protein [Deltaproteobacteria bacterium]